MELFSNQDGHRVFRRMAERSPHAVLRHFPELSGLAGIGRCPATRFPDGYFCCDLVRIDGRDGRFPGVSADGRAKPSCGIAALPGAVWVSGDRSLPCDPLS